MPTRKKLHPEEPPAWLEAFRRWGAKGGTARAKKLTAEERRASARKAAQTRWAGARKKKGQPGSRASS